MMKSSKTVLVVDSVEKAVKFYTEKLAFDVVDLKISKEGPGEILSYANIRKGKCYIILRAPKIEELAEFSFIKRCTSRSVGIYIEMKKGIEKYFAKCQKKGVQLTQQLKDMDYGHKTFSLKDPFGIKLTFAQPIEGFVYKPDNFAGMAIDKNKSEDVLQEEMVKHLKSFGILRRAAKKYAKLWINTYLNK